MTKNLKSFYCCKDCEERYSDIDEANNCCGQGIYKLYNCGNKNCPEEYLPGTHKTKKSAIACLNNHTQTNISNNITTNHSNCHLKCSCNQIKRVLIYAGTTFILTTPFIIFFFYGNKLDIKNIDLSFSISIYLIFLLLVGSILNCSDGEEHHD